MLSFINRKSKKMMTQ